MDIFNAIGQKLLKKSGQVDDTTLPASILNRQQADRFIDLVVDTSVLLKNIRVVRVDHPKGQINRLNLADISSEGVSAVSTPTTYVPSESVIEYDMVKYRSAFDLTRDFEFDNIEKMAVRDTLLNMFTKRIRKDNEIALIQSDDTLPTGDNASAFNKLCGVNNGIRKILLENVPAANILDANGASVSKDLFYVAKGLIPVDYQVNEPDYRWIMNTAAHDKWVYDFQDRQTTAGDNAQGGVAPGPWGIPILKVPQMPNNLNYSGTADRCDIWLTPPQNIIWFVQREMSIEQERRPRQDINEITMYWRVDFQVENPDLVVYIKNIKLSGANYDATP